MKKFYSKLITKFIFIFIIFVPLIVIFHEIYQPLTLTLLDKNNWILKVTDGYFLETNIHKNVIKKVKVCVIDNGFNYSDPNISLINIKKSITEDVKGYHGTMIASLIGAKKSEGRDFSGIIPGIDLYSYHLKEEELDTLSLSKAIIEVADNGIDIINLSLSTTLNDDILYESIIYAINKGTVIICSSGNTANEQELYPASYQTKGVISVGAIDKDLNVLPITTFNNSVDVFAPGEDIFFPNESIKYYGTSFAAPIVTSLVILLKAKYPYLTPKEIEEILVGTSNKYTVNWKYDKKKINIISYKKALNYLKEK